jgi:SAM-dependent methyltransferase
VLTPARRRGVEILDDPNVDASVRHRSQQDVARSNRVLGGLRAARRAVLAAFPSSGPASLLDVGTGLGDIPRQMRDDAAARGIELTTIGVDTAASLLDAARTAMSFGVCASAFALPFADQSIDIVICSQVLHHFATDDAVRVLREMHRVARRTVVIADLRRSWIAALGFWLVSWPLRFHRVTRHDGFVSVLRGFTADDLRELVRAATDATPAVERHLGFRLTASWTK